MVNIYNIYVHHISLFCSIQKKKKFHKLERSSKLFGMIIHLDKNL